MIRVSRPTGRVPEQVGRVRREQRPGFVEADPRSPAQRDRLTRHGSERQQDGVEGCEHVGLRASERRQPESRQFVLERPLITSAEGEVLQEVADALPSSVGDVDRQLREERFGAEHVPADAQQRVSKVPCMKRLDLGQHRNLLVAPRGCAPSASV